MECSQWGEGEGAGGRGPGLGAGVHICLSGRQAGVFFFSKVEAPFLKEKKDPEEALKEIARQQMDPDGFSVLFFFFFFCTMSVFSCAYCSALKS